MAEAKGKAERAAAKVTKLPRSGKPRKCGPIKAGGLAGAALREQLAAAPHVIVFSDGKSELTMFQPVRVEGADAWMTVGAGTMLRQPILVQGGGAHEKPPVIRGFGLFSEEGDQIAWSELPGPIHVAAGSEVKIDRSIIF